MKSIFIRFVVQKELNRIRAHLAEEEKLSQRDIEALMGKDSYCRRRGRIRQKGWAQ